MHRTLAMLYSGGHKGTEAEFGRSAERHDVPEVTLSFDGHKMERDKNVRVLTREELAEGDVSMTIVSRHMGRTYSSADKIRRVIQSIFHMVNQSHHVFAVGWIQGDDTVKGGTGWAVELAKFFNRDVSVFDQERDAWFTWIDRQWQPDTPLIPPKGFCGTGTRNPTDAGKQAIQELFDRSFGAAAETAGEA